MRTVLVDIDEGAQFHVRKFEIIGIDPEKAKDLVSESGLAPGKVVNYRQIERLFERNRDLFPRKVYPEECVQPVLDEHAALVELKIDLTTCRPDEKP